MISDLYKDIKIQLYERATSPLLGSFVISWCLWNYKFLLVVFSSGKAFDKIARIEFVLYPNAWDVALIGIIYPLVTTLFFIFVYPYPARIVFEYTRNQQAKTKLIQQKIEDDTPLTIEESREIRSKFRALERIHDEESAQNRITIDGLKSDLDGSERRIGVVAANLRKAEAEVSRLSTIETKKQNSTKGGESTVLSESHTLRKTIDGRNKSVNTIESIDEMFGVLTKLQGDAKRENINLMKEIFLSLYDKNLHFHQLIDKFNIENNLLRYTLENMEKGNLITNDSNGYRLSITGRNYIIENNIIPIK